MGYVGKKRCRDVILDSLERLEYRGYDSSGFACLNQGDHRLLYSKAVGRISTLRQQLNAMPIDGFIGIGHTRWVTDGKATQENTHPHFDCQKTIAVAHNGIIENHHALRAQLEKDGHCFHSSTDTEIIAHLFESLLMNHISCKAALLELVNQLEGAYAFISILQDFPDQMIVVRKRSPLCIGIGENEMLVASDVLAFADGVKKVVFMPDESFAILKKDTIELYDFTGHALPLVVKERDLAWDAEEKSGHEHYMLKEIYEQKAAIHGTVTFLESLGGSVWDYMGISREHIGALKSITLIGCGTSWHAARIAQFFFEMVCKIPTRVYLASEFRHMPYFAESQSICIALSQSGETVDVLEAVRMINAVGVVPTIVLTNVPSSTLVREAGGFLFTQAGHKVAAASTKAFSTQLAALYWLAHCIALERGMISLESMQLAQEDIFVAAEVLENSIENYKYLISHKLAKKYAVHKKALFLGSHIGYPFAMEAALKLKEIAYIFAQCYPAGELEHGPLSLIDSQTLIVIFSHKDPVIYQKLLCSARQAKARGGHIVAFVFDGQKELEAFADCAFVVPRVKPLLGPLAMTGLMQFFVYAIAKELGCSIDNPRNVATSVTVE